jgi:AmmeMemoRadiSam system protein A
LVNLSESQRQTLLRIVGDTLRVGVDTDRKLELNASDYEWVLQQRRASFVTLRINKELRGCIGTLEARQPTIIAVVDAAFSAAFRDSRFSPVVEGELESLETSIALLSPPESVHVESEAALLESLRIGIDGLILEEGDRRATFLPSVWEQISDPQVFLNRLKKKAGMPSIYWSPNIKISRYCSESFASDFVESVTNST